MGFETAYTTSEPTRAQLDALEEPAVVEFGTPWCGWCRAAQPRIASAFAAHPHLRHIKVEDGRGRSLGRSYGVKLWPTLILLKNGREVARLVRPDGAGAIAAALARIDSAPISAAQSDDTDRRVPQPR